MMKAKYILLAIATVIISSCKKGDEVPPRNINGIMSNIREYVFPLPTFLTSEERQLINEQREAYNELINNNNK